MGSGGGGRWVRQPALGRRRRLPWLTTIAGTEFVRSQAAPERTATSPVSDALEASGGSRCPTPGWSAVSGSVTSLAGRRGTSSARVRFRPPKRP